MWLPLESNPEVMNRYLVLLGITNPKVSFYDVFGLHSDVFAFVPRPIRAMLFLYSINEETENDDAQVVKTQLDEVKRFTENNTFFFTKQTVGNACGTVAILHALMNNKEHIGDVRDGSALQLLSGSPENLTAEGYATFIEQSSQLAEAHAIAAEEGATATPPLDEGIDLHFICFVRVNDRCVELDGRKPCPLLHGACTDDESFATAAAAAIQKKMDRKPDALRYNIIALSDTAS